MQCFKRQFHIRLGYETLSFLFLEQCFHLSLSDEIGCTYFDSDIFFDNSQQKILDMDNLPIYRQSITFLIISPTPSG